MIVYNAASSGISWLLSVAFQQVLSQHFKMHISNLLLAFMGLILKKITYFVTLVLNKGARCLQSYLKSS